MTIKSIADKKSSCGGANSNTGTKGCQIEWGSPLHVIGMRKGFVIPESQEFNKAYIDAQTQLGNFIPLVGAEQFEDMSSEDQFSTNSRGVERLNLLGLPKYGFKYEEGHLFYKEISKLTSYKALDFIFGDEQGNWRVALNSNGSYGGFSAGQALAQLTQTKVLGGDPESKMFTIQLLDRIQWDRNYVILGAENLSWSPEEIDGANQVNISFDAIPADAATTFDFTVLLAGDNDTPVEGLISDDIQYVVNGTVTAATIVENSAGKYTATVAAITAAQVLGIRTYDDGTSTQRILKEGVIYSGDLVTETAV